MSPTLFAIFVNDLALHLKDMNLGIKLGNLHVPVLLYADDVAIISPNENDMQTMLNYLNKWCEKWFMTINMSKTKIIHFRKKKKIAVVLKLKSVLMSLNMSSTTNTWVHI